MTTIREDLEKIGFLIQQLKKQIPSQQTEGPAEPDWKLTNELPGFRPLRDGEEWHFADKWTKKMLPEGNRPLLVGEDEMAGDEAIFSDGTISIIDFEPYTDPQSMEIPRRTKRPLPIEPKLVPLGPGDVRCGDELKHKEYEPIYGISIIYNAGVSVPGNSLLYFEELKDYYLIRRRNSDTFEPCHKEVAQ